MTKPEVTAVGRLLKAKPSQRHVHKVIAMNDAGQVRTVINRSVKELSPAARAVRDAFDIAVIDTKVFGDSDRRLAAALRAAANQGQVLFDAHDSPIQVVTVDDLLAIADELEAH